MFDIIRLAISEIISSQSHFEKRHRTPNRNQKFALLRKYRGITSTFFRTEWCRLWSSDSVRQFSNLDQWMMKCAVNSLSSAYFALTKWLNWKCLYRQSTLAIKKNRISAVDLHTIFIEVPLGNCQVWWDCCKSV